MDRNCAKASTARSISGRVFQYIGSVLFIGAVAVTESCTTRTSETAGASFGNQAKLDPDPIATSTLDGINFEETFIDSLEIGKAGVNTVILNQVRTTDSVYVQLSFLSKKEGTLVEQNKSNWPKDPLSGFHPKIVDFNNDGYKDVTFVSATAARGANEIRRLFIYDPSKDRLRCITNAMDYPNLRYNPKLKCIDGFRVYGGSSTDFLRLQGDSLFMFATVDLYEGLTVTTFDADRTGQVIYRDTTYEGGYIRFDNYSPLEILEEDW